VVEEPSRTGVELLANDSDLFRSRSGTCEVWTRRRERWRCFGPGNCFTFQLHPSSVLEVIEEDSAGGLVFL